MYILVTWDTKDNLSLNSRGGRGVAKIDAGLWLYITSTFHVINSSTISHLFGLKLAVECYTCKLINCKVKRDLILFEVQPWDCVGFGNVSNHWYNIDLCSKAIYTMLVLDKTLYRQLRPTNKIWSVIDWRET